MDYLDRPPLVFAVSLAVLWLSAQAGWIVAHKWDRLDEDRRSDLNIILTAALTLLGLIIGFTFSMATSRYNQRKEDEAAEANAISTEYVRCGLLPSNEAANLRELLKAYTNQRIDFYQGHNAQELQKIAAANAKSHDALWAGVQDYAVAHREALTTLVVSGMNDVLNSESHTQAAWWDRIPVAAWALMWAMAICCDYLVGYTARRMDSGWRHYFLLPLIVSIAFFLIAELDSPRGGTIHVTSPNLESVVRSFSTP